MAINYGLRESMKLTEAEKAVAERKSTPAIADMLNKNKPMKVHSIEVRGMYSGKQGVVKLMDGTYVFFMFSNELQKQFEAEMKAAIDKK